MIHEEEKVCSVYLKGQVEEDGTTETTSDSTTHIVSRLVDGYLDFIVQNLLRLLDEEELAHMISINRSWPLALSKQWLRNYFANKTKNVNLKSLYRRKCISLAEKGSEILQHSSDALLEACCDYVKRRESAIRKLDGALSVMHPLDFDKGPMTKVGVSSYLIVVTVSKFNSTSNCNESSYLVYNRWTLKLVSALSVKGSAYSSLPAESNNSLILVTNRGANWGDCKIQVTVWNLLTGRAQSSFVNVYNYEYGGLQGLPNFLISFNALKKITVYKIQRDAKLEAVLENEPLNFECNVPGNWCHNYFGLLFRKTESSLILHVRSKQDCSLVRKVPVSQKLLGQSLDCVLSPPHLLSQHILAASCLYDKNPTVDVLFLHDKGAKLVHQFIAKGEDVNFKAWCFGKIMFHDEYLVAVCQTSRVAVCWRLPPSFLDLSRRHFDDSTIGKTTKCHVFGLEHQEKRNMTTHCHIDQFGVFRLEHVQLESEGASNNVTVEMGLRTIFSACID